MGTYTGTPRTWVASEMVTAALFNSDVRDPLTALAAAWTTYTPTVSGFTLGNGTVAGYYERFGKTIDFTAIFTFGSTSAAAASGCSMTVPVTASRTTGNNLGCHIVDTGTAHYWGPARLSSTTVATGSLLGTNGIMNNFSTTLPMTWTTGDIIAIYGRYEAA